MRYRVYWGPEPRKYTNYIETPLTVLTVPGLVSTSTNAMFFIDGSLAGTVAQATYLPYGGTRNLGVAAQIRRLGPEDPRTLDIDYVWLAYDLIGAR